MTKFRYLMLAGLSVATAAQAEDRWANEISVAQSETGRMEIAATPFPKTATDDAIRRVYTTRQDDQRVGWQEWTPALATPSPLVPASRVMLRHSKMGQLIGFWLENGTLRIARQTGNNAAFNTITTQGSLLNSLAVTEDSYNRFMVFALARDGSLWGLRQFQTSAWDTIQSIGGVGVASSSPSQSGPLGAFYVNPNALAAALGVGGLVSAFEIGKDGHLHAVSQVDRDHLPSVWSDLGGSDLVDVQALSSGGRATVVAIDSAHKLHSRRQQADGTWGAWQDIPALPTQDAWTVTADNFGQALMFAAQGNSIHILGLNPDGSWSLGNPYEQPFVMGGDQPFGLGILPVLPYRQLSVTVGTDNVIQVAGVDGVGVVYSRPMLNVGLSDGSFTTSTGAKTIGPVTISPDAPDFVVQARGCLIEQNALDGLQHGVASAIAAIPTLAQLGKSVAVNTVCTTDKSSQTIALWVGQWPTVSAVPSGLLNLAPGANPFESVALRLTPSGIQRIFDLIWAKFPKRQHTGEAGMDVVLHSAKLKYNTDSISIEVSGDLGVGKLPIAVSATIKATPGISADHHASCRFKVSASSNVLTLVPNIFVPIGGYYGGQALVDQGADKIADEAGMVCDLVKAFPSVLLVPTLKKMVFNYDHLQIGPTTGITYLAEIPPLPVDRQPKVQWGRVTGFAAGSSATNKFLEFAASSADMNGPVYSWSLRFPDGKVKALPNTRIVQVNFPVHPPLFPGQTLGQLTVTVTDADHMGQAAASYTAPVLVTSDLTHGPQGNDTHTVPNQLQPN